MISPHVVFFTLAIVLVNTISLLPGHPQLSPHNHTENIWSGLATRLGKHQIINNFYVILILNKLFFGTILNMALLLRKGLCNGPS